MSGAPLGNMGALFSGEGLGGISPLSDGASPLDGLLAEMPKSSLEPGSDAGGLLQGEGGEMGPEEFSGGTTDDAALAELRARGQGLRAGTISDLAAIMSQGRRQRF